MKRTLLTAITLYLLYDRQKRVEARTKAWRSRLEADLTRWAKQSNQEIGVVLRDFNDAWSRFAVDLNKECQAFAERVADELRLGGIAGGKR